MYTDPDTTISTTAKVARVYRLGSRRLTRAHLALQFRPSFYEAFAEALSQVSGALGAQLGCEVSASGRFLETVFKLDRCLADNAAFALFELDAAGTACLLELERPVLNAALDRLSGGAGRTAPASRLTRIEEAAFGFLSLLAVQALRQVDLIERYFAPRLRVVNLRPAELLPLVDGGATWVAAQVLLRVAGVEGQGRLFIPSRPLQTALQAEPQVRPTGIPEPLLAVALAARAFVGRTVLDAAELQALREGDVVLFEALGLEAGAIRGEGRLSTSGFELFGSFTPEGFHLTRALARTFPQESSMSSPSVPNDDAPALPVDVEIELTRVRLHLSDLATLRPGTILPLHINASEPVVLRIGDRAVARAELVEIDGEVGARILTLFS